MGIRGLKKWALLLTFWVALQSRWVRATDLTGGNLTLTGTADIQGNTISLGTGATSYPGWQGAYTDGTTSYVDFTGTRSANIWRWWQNGSGTPQLQLTLDNNNKLTFYDQSSTPVAMITLDPLGTSTFANSLTVAGTFMANGSDNEMPNQTLATGNSVLTVGIADGRYVVNSATSFVLGTGTHADGINSFAIGNWSTASGDYSVALGEYAVAGGAISTAGNDSTADGVWSTAFGGGSAYGNLSTAFAQGTASGYYSTAIGYHAIASGYDGTAIGLSATSSGNGSLALGISSLASGDYSVVIGNSSTASASGAVALGSYNTASGNSSTVLGYSSSAPSMGQLTSGQFNVGTFSPGGGTSWISTDPLFELGNGADATHLSDALVVYKNGNATFQGNVHAAGISTTGTVAATTFVTTATGTGTGDIPMFGH